MAVWSPLITNWAVNTVDSAPRTARIDTIIGHHVAGTSELDALAQFAPGGRVVTPNVFIARKRIWGIVPEDRRAFTSGSAVDDDRALTFEALNESAGPGWSFHPETLESIALLQADWSTRYGIELRHAQPGVMEHQDINRWFGRGYATACAGPAYDINQRIADTAAALRPAPISESETTMLYLMIGDGEGRYGRPNAQLFATYDGHAFVKIKAADANAFAVTNLAGRSFANVSYGPWEGYQRAAEIVIDAT